MNQTVQAFVDAINAHDVVALANLMTDDHLFVDPYGTEVRGRETMITGWRGYFEWFPDYYIEVTDRFEEGSTCGMFGFAGGSFKGNAEAKWRVPAAWKAFVTDGRISVWQVIADTKIPFEIIERNS